MAAFTMDLWEVLEHTDDIGLNEYPIFNEAYRPQLNKKIIDRYWNREIGLETIDQFIFNMRRKMNEIMPYYNQLYLSTQIHFDPLTTISMETLGTGTNETEADSKTDGTTGSDTTTKSVSVSSTFPQSRLDDNNVGAYADNSQENDGTGTQVNTASENRNDVAKGKSTASSTTKGYQGSPATLLMEYRRAIINVDLMILSDVSELFMSVLNTDNEYFTNGI